MKGMLSFRFLMHFDLSAIPSAATVDSATFMHEVLVHNPPGQALPMTFAELTNSDWQESTANWPKYFCNPDRSGPLYWNTPGGDFTLQDSASWSTVDAGHKEVDVTSLVQRVVDTNGQLHAIMFLDGDTSETEELSIYIASSESVDFEKPSLVVQWHP
jgi:hypothetical protein